MSRTKAISAGFLAGLAGGIVMTTAMLLLATLAVATPLVIIGDRLSVFFPPGPFLSLMGKVGGYNHLKQLGVGSTIAGQLLVAAIAGAIFGLFARRNPACVPVKWTISIFVVLPIVALAIALWPVLGTSYIGLPIDAARLVTLVGFALCVFFLAHACCWVSLSDHPKDREACHGESVRRRTRLRVHSDRWKACVRPRRDRPGCCGRRRCAGSQTVSRSDIQL